jgi:hypothetical protein
MNRHSWENIGTETLNFDGSNLSYSKETSNSIDGYNITTTSFNAVSGRPIEVDGGYCFDYTDQRQQVKSTNCQTIRQSVITNLLKAGNDLRIVQVFAGHK